MGLAAPRHVGSSQTGDHTHVSCISRRVLYHQGFPSGSELKVSACNAGDLGSIPGSGRSPGEGNGNPLQYSCLETPMDGGTWWATVQGVGHNLATKLPEMD